MHTYSNNIRLFRTETGMTHYILSQTLLCIAWRDFCRAGSQPPNCIFHLESGI